MKEVHVEIVVKGRHCEVSDRFRALVEEKLSRLEKYDQRIIRVDVEVSKEANPRIADQASMVEITIRRRGPVVRAEAAAEDKLTALDRAMERLQTQVRKAADRRRVHHGSRNPTPLAHALSDAPMDLAGLGAGDTDDDAWERKAGPLTVVGDGPPVVREKVHPATPMTLDQALYEMELVGHDFFLFMDKDEDRPAVVYRRRGYDYGVIRLAE